MNVSFSRIGPCDTNRKELLPLSEMVWPEDDKNTGREEPCFKMGYEKEVEMESEGGTIHD